MEKTEGDESHGKEAGDFNSVIGLRIVEATPDRVVAEIDVTPSLHQQYGIVHGGVYSSVVEATASLGAVTWLGGRGDVVGVSNHTHFLRAVRQGRLRVVAVPVDRRHGSQLWTVSVQLPSGDTVATGTVAFRSVVSASSLGSMSTEP